MANTYGGVTYSDDEIRNFFATTDNAGIAAKAASLGMNADQIAQAAKVAGKNWTTADVTGASQGLGYDFGGSSGAVQRATAASSPGGVQVGNNYYTGQQVKDFYAGGGNDNEYAQKAGITDPWKRREIILSARQAAGAVGTAAYSGDAGLQKYFQQYRKYNPNGANVNSYEGWLADQNPHTRDAMRTGTFTGTPSSPKDSAPGGIYYNTNVSYDQTRNGLGKRGWDDGWGDGDSGGPGSGATGAGGGGGGSAGGGSTGAWGSQYSASNGAPQMNLASMQGPTNMGVDPATQTVAGQLQTVLANDSPLIQQARTRALQKQNADGRLNTSMAQGAADSAMYDAALQIATPDANTYNLAAQTNAATANTFSRDNNAYARQQDMANFNVNANDWAARQEAARTAARDAALNAQGVANSATANTNSQNAAATAATNAERAAATRDMNNARAEFAAKVASISSNTEMDANARTNAISTLRINYNAIITNAVKTLGWGDPGAWLIQGTGA